MEDLSVNISPDKHWTEEKEKLLIAFFSEHSCLWKHKTLDYKNRELRWKTLEKLRVLLSSQPPPAAFTVEDIKNKFRNLRTTFQRQFKIVAASRVSDDVFVPQWRHYQQLLFLESEGPTEPPTPPLTSDPPPPPRSSEPQLRCLWSEEKERALIDFYCDHQSLWNKRSENHCNQQVRMKLLETLSAELSDPTTFLSVEDVKNKFKNLRTVFNRELKLVQSSRGSCRPFSSKWKYFPEMMFLTEGRDSEGLDELRRLEDDGPRGLLLSSSYESLKTTSPGQTLLPQESTGRVKSESPVRPVTSSRPSSPPDIKPFILAESSAPSGGAQNHTSLMSTSTPADVSVRSPQDSHLCSSPSPRHIPAPEVTTLSDAHCFWSDAKTQLLINFFAGHSCLWNHRSESYRNRHLKKSLLERLSHMLSSDEDVPFTVEDIKAKFRNLRTIFQREHRSMRSSQTCGSEDFYVPKWKHYVQLMFLCDSCDEDQEKLLNSSRPPLDPPHSPTPPDSRRSSPASSPSTLSSRTDSRRRKRATSDVLDLMTAFCQNQNQSRSRHSGFLRYVEELLNDAPEHRVKRLKKKIIQTIFTELEDA